MTFVIRGILIGGCLSLVVCGVENCYECLVWTRKIKKCITCYTGFLVLPYTRVCTREY